MVDEIERWVKFRTWPYEVSDLGRVRSIRTGAIMKQNIIPAGYAYARFRLNGECKSFSVHRLVAICFHGEPPVSGLCVAHGDGVKLNNRASNLRWTTYSDNHLDKRLHGTATRGERSAQAKLTETQIKSIRIRVASGETQASIAREFGLYVNHVWKIFHRTSWAHVE